jgi:hypothetical protein
MDFGLPHEIISELAQGRKASLRRVSKLSAMSGNRRHMIVEITDRGFVIEADGLPQLRGYVDIMRGEQRIGRRLVVFSGAAEGLARYEFKHDCAAREVPADYVKPDAIALLTAPR